MPIATFMDFCTELEGYSACRGHAMSRATTIEPRQLFSSTRARLRSVILSFGQRRRAVGRQCDQLVPDSGDLLDQVLAVRVVPAIDRVGMVCHGGTSSAALTAQLRCMVAATVSE